MESSSFSRILIFIQRDADRGPSDADTLLVRLQLGGLLGQVPTGAAPIVVVELADEYFRTISATEEAREMFVGSKTVALLLAELSENPHHSTCMSSCWPARAAESIWLRPVAT